MAAHSTGLGLPRTRLRGSNLAALTLAILALASTNPAHAVPPAPAASSLASARVPSLDPIAARCIGSRRDYRDFDHCWHRRAKSRRAVAYCSRICR